MRLEAGGCRLQAGGLGLEAGGWRLEAAGPGLEAGIGWAFKRCSQGLYKAFIRFFYKVSTMFV